MSARSSCCCPVCELERALLVELIRHPNENQYRSLTSQSSILSAFPTCADLLSHLRESYAAETHVSGSDTILGELLRLSRNPQLEIGRHLLVLILMPAIHRTSSQISAGFPSLLRDDIAQHLVTAMLDIISSPTMRTQTSHFAFTITRAMRRSAFRWAVREAGLALAANGEETILRDLPADAGASFESKVLLSEFLTRCLSSGLLSPMEHELLVLFKIRGVSSEVLAARQKVSDVAFRHRMQRVIQKLRRAARTPSMTRQRTNDAVA
jgi:DNA-directed RNA polymerase specialized sigma24 family protein